MEKVLKEKVCEEKTPFSLDKAVFVYLLGGLIGTLWETLLNLCRGNGFVYCNGSILTPFNVVYGLGALVIVLCLRNEKNIFKTYIIGALGGGLVEYVLSFFEEIIYGTRSWDYSQKFLNIGGRTTLPYMLVWGLLCVIAVFCIYHPLEKLYDRIPRKIVKTIAICVLVLLVVDWTITLCACLRYSARFNGTQPYTIIGQWIDYFFDDAFMIKRFPSMKFS